MEPLVLFSSGHTHSWLTRGLHFLICDNL
uniref:Uncharacterized protein n=1 Tax=Arundo donax TaxID=35708 RepID=A0A0A9CDY8_ARUDO